MMRNDGQQPYNIISNIAYYIRVCENENTQECNKRFLIQLRKKAHKEQQKNKQAKTGKTLSYLSTRVTYSLSSFKKLRVGHCLGNKVYYKWWYFPYTALQHINFHSFVSLHAALIQQIKNNSLQM